MNEFTQRLSFAQAETGDLTGKIFPEELKDTIKSPAERLSFPAIEPRWHKLESFSQQEALEETLQQISLLKNIHTPEAFKALEGNIAKMREIRKHAVEYLTGLQKVPPALAKKKVDGFISGFSKLSDGENAVYHVSTAAYDAMVEQRFNNATAEQVADLVDAYKATAKSHILNAQKPTASEYEKRSNEVSELVESSLSETVEELNKEILNRMKRFKEVEAAGYMATHQR